ncbi:MAG TPA: hypothetical protein G4O02_08120 [Caldilineae bacterium]|nr:hypothetical protein [Caldilineae bacterium]
MSSIPIWTKLWITGGFLVLLGAGLPLLMILQILPSTFLLAFISFAASNIGVVFGYIGMTTYVRVHRGGPPFDDRPPS